ncbi:MAG: hypothetical protein HGA65_14750, partial [Oscillochloris sp.]|nr:hypothetical protein [Oscillochloris sp.]
IGGKSVSQQLEERIRAEVDQIRPKLPTIRPEIARIGEEQVAILRVRDHQTFVATYDNRAIEWTGAALREINLSDLFRLHLRRSGQFSQNHSSMAGVWLTYGELFWPAQPPSRQKVATAAPAGQPGQATYDAQRRAMIWPAQPFQAAEGNSGYRCTLTTSLRHAFAEIRPQHAATLTASNPEADLDQDLRDSNPENLLEGTLQVEFDNRLLSQISGEIVAEHPLLGGVPISRRTVILADVKIDSNALFEQRQHTALLNFQMPDVSFGAEWRERINDLKQICADTGFWIEDQGDTSGSEPLILSGVRSTHFHDIHLLLGVEYKTTDLTRELHFKQYVESRQISSGTLDTRIVLVGSGKGVEAEIAGLQLKLGQLMHERLRYLRAE